MAVIIHLKNTFLQVNPDLLKKLDCKNFFFSTNGAKFGHPHDVTVARVINIGGDGATLYFNYETDYTLPWNKKAIKDKHGYSAEYGDGHLSVDIANL